MVELSLLQFIKCFLTFGDKLIDSNSFLDSVRMLRFLSCSPLNIIKSSKNTLTLILSSSRQQKVNLEWTGSSFVFFDSLNEPTFTLRGFLVVIPVVTSFYIQKQRVESVWNLMAEMLLKLFAFCCCMKIFSFLNESAFWKDHTFFKSLRFTSDGTNTPRSSRNKQMCQNTLTLIVSPQMKFPNIQFLFTGGYIFGSPESKTFDYTTCHLCWKLVFQGINTDHN